MKKVLLVCVCTAMLASCGQNSADYKKLERFSTYREYEEHG